MNYSLLLLSNKSRMMKKILQIVILSLLIITVPKLAYSQKFTKSSYSITGSELHAHMKFLASPLLKGRANSEPELNIAAAYIASQAELSGLKPVGPGGFFQYYSVTRKSIDYSKTSLTITGENGEVSTFNDKLFQLIPMGASDFQLEGEVVFAGYGIRADKYKYNDFDTLKLQGKILLVMNRAPLKEDGKTCAFDDQNWLGMNGLQMKIQGWMMSRPKAVIVVTDPKSGFDSFDQASPGLASYLASSLSLKGQKSMNYDIPGLPKIIFVNRKIADKLLEGTGQTLEGLQNAIDSDLKSRSFRIKNKYLKINEVSLTEELQLPNIAAMVEGSDPALKNEYIIFSAHMDHVGGEGGNINPGADDNASGCAALLEIAEAFSMMPKKPSRSVLFLWVSGEEVGLFGSQAYIDNPLVPLDKTVADLNMDMIGRIKGVADTSDQNPMSAEKSVFVISDNQSRQLEEIASTTAARTGLTLDYSLSGRSHPLQLFSRSDHFNFVKKDIPVLFFTSGLHTDYHTPGDVLEKIEFGKMELVSRTMFEIGLQLASNKERLVVDSPYSERNKPKPPTK
jgi:hypothetical protein